MVNNSTSWTWFWLGDIRHANAILIPIIIALVTATPPPPPPPNPPFCLVIKYQTPLLVLVHKLLSFQMVLTSPDTGLLIMG